LITEKKRKGEAIKKGFSTAIKSRKNIEGKATKDLKKPAREGGRESQGRGGEKGLIPIY